MFVFGVYGETNAATRAEISEMAKVGAANRWRGIGNHYPIVPGISIVLYCIVFPLIILPVPYCIFCRQSCRDRVPGI